MMMRRSPEGAAKCALRDFRRDEAIARSDISEGSGHDADKAAGSENEGNSIPLL